MSADLVVFRKDFFQYQLFLHNKNNKYEEEGIFIIITCQDCPYFDNIIGEPDSLYVITRIHFDGTDLPLITSPEIKVSIDEKIEENLLLAFKQCFAFIWEYNIFKMFIELFPDKEQDKPAV